jgi:DNA-binding transcriptional LysR family regulator
MPGNRHTTNIPTDLLRALIAVVESGSFTKAGMMLGITQPAVSTQIKRLQVLLGCDLFDRSGNGLKLTAKGEVVVSHARRVLALNDQILQVGGAGPRPELLIRVGTASDFVASRLPITLARFRERWPDVRFIVRTAHLDTLVRELHSGNLDLFIALSMKEPHDARRSWPQEVVWVRGLSTCIDQDRPVPLVSFGEPCIYRRLAVQVLKKAGLEWEDVFVGPGMLSLASAVAAGLGIMPILRQRALDLGMVIWEDGPLPTLPDLHSGIYVREGGALAAYEQLAEDIAETLYRATPRRIQVRKKAQSSAA